MLLTLVWRGRGGVGWGEFFTRNWCLEWKMIGNCIELNGQIKRTGRNGGGCELNVVVQWEWDFATATRIAATEKPTTCWTLSNMAATGENHNTFSESIHILFPVVARLVCIEGSGLRVCPMPGPHSSIIKYSPADFHSLHQVPRWPLASSEQCSVTLRRALILLSSTYTSSQFSSVTVIHWGKDTALLMLRRRFLIGICRFCSHDNRAKYFFWAKIIYNKIKISNNNDPTPSDWVI